METIRVEETMNTPQAELENQGNESYWNLNEEVHVSEFVCRALKFGVCPCVSYWRDENKYQR